MKNEKILYLREMGMDDDNIPTDIKNHRVRVVKNIDIIYKNEPYNMFFEFCFWERYTWRTENKRTGEPLKHPKRELLNSQGLSIDTEFEKDEINEFNGHKFKSSWRHSKLEKDVYKKNYSYTKKDILKIVNTYAVEKYTKVILIEEETRRIIESIGGYREKSILNNDSYMNITEEWNDEHKVIEVIERIRTETEPKCYRRIEGNSCKVDIVTGKITG